MTWKVSADPVDFDEAIAWFKKRVSMSKADFESLSAEAKRKAFTVANVAQLDVVSQVWNAIEKAIKAGTPFADFKKAIGPELRKAWAGSVDDPPWRLECLTGDTLVSGAVVRAVHRRWYEGDVVEVVTAVGRKLTTTPNHPMLTRRGWVAAGELQEGDDLIGYRRQEDVSARRDGNAQRPPATIAEVFEALSRAGVRERIEPASVDLHGETPDGDVDVARADRELVLGYFASLRQPLEQQLFPETDASRPRFCDECGHLAVITQRCGFCDRPVLGPAALEPRANGIVGGVERSCEGDGALTPFVSGDQLIDGNVLPAHRRCATLREEVRTSIGQRPRDAGISHDGSDPAARHPDERGDLRDALPGEVEFDRVRGVSRRPFSGHVYNLSTPVGYFLIGGLYTGNTIFRTNVQLSYGAGRYRQAKHPDVASDRPVWMFDAILDGRETEVCRAADGTKLANDDPWWSTHTPPCHFNCRSSFVALTSKQAGKITLQPPTEKSAEGFGLPPDEQDWEPEEDDYPAALWTSYQAKIPTD